MAFVCSHFLYFFYWPRLFFSFHALFRYKLESCVYCVVFGVVNAVFEYGPVTIFIGKI